MEVVNSPTRRAPPASQQVVIVSVPSSQPSSNQGEQYQLTELKNVTSKPLSSVRRTTAQNYEPKPAVTPLEPAIEEDLTEARGRSQPQAPLQGGSDEAFQLRLIDAIRNEPCLYDPSDEHYGNKHTSAQFRAQVWVQIARDIQWQDDTHLLQMQWKRLRDRYVRRKRRSNEDPSRERHPSDGDRIIDAMRWLDQYLVDSSERNSTSTSQGSSQVPPSREVYYVEPQTMDQDVMISGYQQPAPSQSHHSATTHRVVHHVPAQSQAETHGVSSGGYIIVRPNSVSASGPHQTIRLVTNTNNDVTGSPHSSSSDISVGSSGATKGQSLAVMSNVQSGGSQVQQIQSRTQPRVHIIHAPSSQNHQSSQYVQKVVQSAEPGITVTASGSAGMVGQVKKDSAGGQGTMTMIIDPNTYYQSGAQKMYRLVNVSDHVDNSAGISSNSIGPPRKRIALVQRSTGSATHVPVSGISTTVSGRGQLGDDIILDDGIQERTIVIDQQASESPLLSESPGLGSMMISGHQAVVPPRHHSQVQQRVSHQQQHIQHQPSRVPAPPSVHHSPAPGYLHQSQYDADLQFQQLISSHLSRLNEDDKALTKLNIQRILLDARFGAGTCSRMIQEEEMSEAAANSVVAHEMVSNSR